MIDKQEAAIFKSKQDFNQNKEKILEYMSCVAQMASFPCELM